MAGILSSSKNMCSVLQRPMPCAPNSTACFASLGLSALVLTFSVLMSSAQFMIVPKSPESSGGTVFTSPLMTSPVVPFREMKSPSLNVYWPIPRVLPASSTLISEHPDTQHLPMPLATTAACEVIPPLAVRIPSAATIPARSSGDVSSLTRIAFWPFATAASASAALK